MAIIDLRGGDNNSEILAQMLLRQQQAEQAREELAIRKKHLELTAQEAQMKQQQQAAQQQSMLNAFMQAAQDPNIMQSGIGGQMQQALGGMADARTSTPQAFAQVNALAGPQEMGNKVAPSAIDQQRAELDAERTTKNILRYLPEDEGQKFLLGVKLMQQGVPKEAVEWMIPESAMQTAQRVELNLKNKRTLDTEAADNAAFELLKEQGFKVASAVGANALLSDIVKADAAFKNTMKAQKDQQAFTANENEKARANTNANAAIGRLTQFETDIRKEFMGSDVVKRSQAVVQSYGKILEQAAKKTGAADIALAYAFINMQDQTAAREGEQKILRQAGSMEDRISARFGKWRRGTVFSDGVRQQILDAAGDMLKGHKAAVDELSGYYAKRASERGIDPRRILFDPLGPSIKKIDEEKARREYADAVKSSRP